jgi:hypothetical protein
MGFFSKKTKPNLLEVLEIDLTKYPDDSFIIDKIHSTDDRTVYFNNEFENKFFGLFTELSILSFNNSAGRNFLFRCSTHEFDKYDLPDFIQKIYDVYGKDDNRKGPYIRQDSEDIEVDHWSGRNWMSDKLLYPCALSFDEVEGLSFTIWTINLHK